jgi:hypothetical protein
MRNLDNNTTMSCVEELGGMDMDERGENGVFKAIEIYLCKFV